MRSRSRQRTFSSPRRFGVLQCAVEPVAVPDHLGAHRALEAQQLADQRHIQIGARGQQHQPIAGRAMRLEAASAGGAERAAGREPRTKSLAYASISARASPPITRRMARDFKQAAIARRARNRASAGASRHSRGEPCRMPRPVADEKGQQVS